MYSHVHVLEYPDDRVPPAAGALKPVFLIATGDRLQSGTRSSDYFVNRVESCPG